MITIIIVSLNSEKFISSAISSVLSLDIPDLELLIIDGKSSDNTLNVINQYKEVVDNGFYGHKTIRWISEKDSGIYDAMNKGIKLATHNWIYFLGSDDILLPDFQKAVGSLKKMNNVYYFNCFMPALNKVHDGRFNSYKLSYKNICHQSIIYPKQHLLHYFFDLNYKIVADYYLNLQLWSNPIINFVYTPITIAVFSGDGISSNNIELKFYNNIFSITKHFLGLRYAIYGKAVYCLHNVLKRITK